jgi:hypothetical protein
MQPLKKLRKQKVVVWNEKYQKIYDTVRAILSSDMLLTFPNFQEPLFVGTDASNRGIGACLYQEYNDKTHYSFFAARSLHDGEKGYGATK